MSDSLTLFYMGKKLARATTGVIKDDLAKMDAQTRVRLFDFSSQHGSLGLGWCKYVLRQGILVGPGIAAYSLHPRYAIAAPTPIRMVLISCSCRVCFLYFNILPAPSNAIHTPSPMRM